MATNNTMNPPKGGTEPYTKNSELGRWVHHMLFVEKIHPEIFYEGARHGCYIRDTGFRLLQKDKELNLNRIPKYNWKSFKDGVGRQFNAELKSHPELNIPGPYIPPAQENPQVNDAVPAPAPVAEAAVAEAAVEDPTIDDDDVSSNSTVDLTTEADADRPTPSRKRKEVEPDTDIFAGLSPQIVKALEDSRVRTLLLQGTLCYMYPVTEEYNPLEKESRLAVNYLLPSGTDREDTSEAALDPRLCVKGKTLYFNLRVPKPFLAASVLTHDSTDYISNDPEKKMRHKAGMEKIMEGIGHLKSMDFGRVVSEISIPLPEDCEKIYPPFIVKVDEFDCFTMLHFELKTKEQPYLKKKEAQKMKPNVVTLKGLDKSSLD